MIRRLRRKSAPTPVIIPAGENTAANRHLGAHPAIPRFIRLFSVPILLAWLATVAFLNVAVPQLEIVGQQHSVSLAPSDAPSLQAMKQIGKNFDEFDSDSSAMILLESDEPLGKRTQPLGLRLGGGDPAVFEKGRGEVGQH